MNTLGFGVWGGKPILDTVHEPKYYLPRHRSREAFEAESTGKYNGPRRIAQISHAEATLSYRASIGWEKQYDRKEHLGDVAEDVLEADRERPGILFIDGSNDLQEYLRAEYGIHLIYKDSTIRLRVSISPFNTELEIGVLGRAVETYKSSVNDVDFSPMRNRRSLLGDVL